MVRKTRNCKYKYRNKIRSRKHKRGGRPVSPRRPVSSRRPVSPRSPPTRHSRIARLPEPDIFRVYFKINGPDITDIDRTRRQFSIQIRMGFQVRNPDPLRMVIFEHVPDPDSEIHDNTPNSVILSCDRRIPYYEECMDHVISHIRRLVHIENNLPLHLRIHDGGQLREYVI